MQKEDKIISLLVKVQETQTKLQMEQVRANEHLKNINGGLGRHDEYIKDNTLEIKGIRKWTEKHIFKIYTTFVLGFLILLSVVMGIKLL